MDSFGAKEFKRLADEEPDAHVQYCNGIQYCEQPGALGEDVYWVRKIYSNVSKKANLYLLLFFLKKILCYSLAQRNSSRQINPQCRLRLYFPIM